MMTLQTWSRFPYVSIRLYLPVLDFGDDADLITNAGYRGMLKKRVMGLSLAVDVSEHIGNQTE